MDRRLSLQRACDSDLLNDCGQSPIEELYASIEKTMSAFLFVFERRRNTSRWRRIASKIMVIFSIITCIHFLVYISWVLSNLEMNHETRISCFTFITLALTDLLGGILFISWQESGSLRKFLKLIHFTNGGKGVAANAETLRKLSRRFNRVTFFHVGYSILFMTANYAGFRPRRVNIDIISMQFYYPELRVITYMAINYLFVGWSIQIHIYAFCISAATYEARHFNEELANIHTNKDMDMLAFFTRAIDRHTSLATAIRHLDSTMKRYAFTMIALLIPSTLFTCFMIISRVNAPKSEMLLISPSIFFCTYAFVCITIFPSRLHDEILKSRSVFCRSIQRWLPYNKAVYTAALAFSAHLQQDDLGVSIWGFAMLSKPMILTTLSVMITCLAMLLQFTDCTRRQLEERLGMGNMTMLDELSFTNPY